MISVPTPTETCIQNILNVLNYARRPISPLRKVKVGLLVYRKLPVQEQTLEECQIGTLRTVRLDVRKLLAADSNSDDGIVKARLLESS